MLYLMVILLSGLLFSPIEKKFLRSPQDKFAGIFFIAMFLSTLTVLYLTYMIETTITILKIALIYYFIVITVNNEKKLKGATWTMVGMMTIVGLMAVLQSHGYDITGAGMVWSADKGVWQIKGIGKFDNPNDIAHSVVLVVPFSLGLLVQTKGILTRIVALTFLFISAYCIYLTRSRGGQIAFGTCLVTWIYFWTTSRKLRRRLFVLGAIGLFAIFAVRTAGYRGDESAMGRIEAWSEGWTLLKSHPIIGVGKEQFIEYHTRDTHNSYVRAAAELGLIGLYAFIGILYSSVATLFRIQRSPDYIKWRIYYVGYFSFLSAYMIASLFATRTYDSLFLMCVALTGVLGRFALKDTDEVSAKGLVFQGEGVFRNKNVFGLSIAVLIVWYVFLRQVW